MSTKLYIGNLNFNTTESQIRDLFADYGDISDVHLPMDKMTGRPRGFGFITLEDAGKAQNAISELNGQSVEGRNLTVNEARPREERGGFSGGGYNRNRNASFSRNQY